MFAYGLSRNERRFVKWRWLVALLTVVVMFLFLVGLCAILGCITIKGDLVLVKYGAEQQETVTVEVDDGSE